jgi:hypothetical protein
MWKPSYHGVGWQWINPGLPTWWESRNALTLSAVRIELVEVLSEARSLLALPGNHFAGSQWKNGDDALHDLDQFIALLRAGDLPDRGDLSILFAPTGSVQEVSISSGWGVEFLAIASRFDAACERVYVCADGSQA